MKVSNVTDLMELSENETVMCVTGVVDSLFEQNSGTNEHGDWRLQNMVIKDCKDPKVKIKVKIADRDALPMNMKGKRIWLSCTQNGKGAWTGLKMKSDTYRGKTSMILSCTASAELSLADPASGHTPPPAEAPQDPLPAPKEQTKLAQPLPGAYLSPASPATQTSTTTAPQTAATTPAKDPKEAREAAFKAAVFEARKALGSAANAYWLCIKAGEFNFKRYQAEIGEPMTENQFQAMVSSLFIYMDRQGLIQGLPHGDIAAYLPTKTTTTNNE